MTPDIPELPTDTFHVSVDSAEDHSSAGSENVATDRLLSQMKHLLDDMSATAAATSLSSTDEDRARKLIHEAKARSRSSEPTGRPPFTLTTTTAEDKKDAEDKEDTVPASEIESSDDIIDWWTAPYATERERVVRDVFVVNGVKYDDGLRHALAAIASAITDKSSLNVRLYRSNIPRRLHIDRSGMSFYSYAMPGLRLVSRSVVGKWRSTPLSAVQYLSADLLRNKVLVRSANGVGKSFFGVHPDARTLDTHATTILCHRDFTRFAWSLYNGGEYDEVSGVSADTVATSYATRTTHRESVGLVIEKDDPTFKAVLYLDEAAVNSNWKIEKSTKGSSDLPDKSAEVTPAISAATEIPSTYVRPNGEIYVARNIIAGTTTIQDVQAIRKSREASINILLVGSPGTGKTALAEASLENLLTIECSANTESADFIGSYVPNGPDTFEWRFGPLAEAAMNGWPLLVDEIAMCDPRVLPVLYSAMDGRKKITVTANPSIGEIPIAEGFYVIGACNPDVPGAIMSDALLSRFPMQIEVTTDYSMLKKIGVDQKIINASANLAKQKVSGSVVRAPQTRDLLSFQKIKDVFGIAPALANFVAGAEPSDLETYVSVVSSVFGVTVSPIKI